MTTLRSGVLLAALGALVASIAILPGSSAGARQSREHTQRAPCKRPHERVVAQSPQLAVITRRPKDRLVVCLKSTRHRETVSDDTSWFPSVAVAGRVVAFADIDSEADKNELVVEHFGRHLRFRVFETNLQVGSIVVKKNGAVAWIDCVATTDDAQGHPRQCRKPNQSDTNYVFAGPPGYTSSTQNAPLEKTLDEGPGVDPSSLRLHGSRLTWKHDGDTRKATLK